MRLWTRKVSQTLTVLSLSAALGVVFVQSASAKLSDYDPTNRNSKVREGAREADPTAPNSTAGKALPQVDPTNPNSAVREGMRQIDPTNPNSAVREGMRQIDPSTPNSALRKGIRQADPTDPNSSVGRVVDKANPVSAVTRSANKGLANAGETFHDQFLDPTKQLLLWSGGGIFALLVAARLLRGKRA